ncbi:MAG: hypothetical protein LBU90_00190 [Bacteroidales bacterium]|jgi:hypothetical protein|nr:hypothetical protein [Bacteroidales bacterium]
MKKLIFVGLTLLTGSAFCQSTPATLVAPATPPSTTTSVSVVSEPVNPAAPAALSKTQSQQVNKLNKETAKKVDAVVADGTLSADEKKAKVAALKHDRDTVLQQSLTADQVSALQAKDQIDWTSKYQKIDKTEAARKKAEMNTKITDINNQIKILQQQNDALQSQINDLRNKQEVLRHQESALKSNIKAVKAQYK